MSKLDKSSGRVKHIAKKTVKKGKGVNPKDRTPNTRGRRKVALEKALHEVLKRERRDRSSSLGMSLMWNKLI